MELKVNDYFEDSKRRNREEFRERVRQIKAQRHEFLKHLLSIHATILGFSVGLRAATGETNTNPTLVIAWSIQILVLVLGTTVIKAQLDSDEYRARKASDFLIDMAEILQMEEQGCFDGQMEKRDGLITAALVQMMPHLIVGLKKISGNTVSMRNSFRQGISRRSQGNTFFTMDQGERTN